MNKSEIIIIILSGLTLVTGWLAYVVRSLYKKGMSDERMSGVVAKVHGYDVRKRECDAKFSEHAKLIDVSYERMAATSGMVDRMSVMIDRIYDMFFKNENLSKRKSPRQLTTAGMELLNISGGKECIDKYTDLFIHAIMERTPRVPYDVERLSMEVILARTSNEVFDDIKNFIYNSPGTIELDGETVEVNIFSIGFVMSIYLRDIYFEKQKI